MRNFQFGDGNRLTFGEWCRRLEGSLSYHLKTRSAFGDRGRAYVRPYYDKRWTVCEASEYLRAKPELEIEDPVAVRPRSIPRQTSTISVFARG